MPRTGNLMGEVNSVRPETVKLGENLWTSSWFEAVCGKKAFLSLWQCFDLMSIALARFGNHLYESGKPLYYLRHLVAYAERMFPTVKGRLSAVWDVTSATGANQASCSRLFGELVQVCWYSPGVMFWLVQNWWSLRARRKHLILPSDLCMSSSKDVFLRIVGPKPGRRGLGSFLDSVFGSLDGEALLFNGTPSSFRSRWTKVLVALKTPTTFRITLAGLRAGGAVELYRQGRTIHDIFWALRLRHLVSLLRYLQEVSTSVRTRDLPIDAKTTITLCFRVLSFTATYGCLWRRAYARERRLPSLAS